MKLFAIDGCDGSGKQTQAELVTKRLKEDGYNVSYVSFPRYETPYSVFAKSLLNGDFGTSVSDVSAKAASILFAVDRFASVRLEDWTSADIVIADRYVSSNMVYQAAKLQPEEREEFIKWLSDLEYNILGIPEPAAVIFLDVPPETSLALRAKRGVLKNGEKNDTYESDDKFMHDVYQSAICCSETLGWKTVKCTEDDKKMRDIGSINNELYSLIKSLI